MQFIMAHQTFVCLLKAYYSPVNLTGSPQGFRTKRKTSRNIGPSDLSAFMCIRFMFQLVHQHITVQVLTAPCRQKYTSCFPSLSTCWSFQGSDCFHVDKTHHLLFNAVVGITKVDYKQSWFFRIKKQQSFDYERIFFNQKPWLFSMRNYWGILDMTLYTYPVLALRWVKRTERFYV